MIDLLQSFVCLFCHRFELMFCVSKSKIEGNDLIIGVVSVEMRQAMEIFQFCCSSSIQTVEIKINDNSNDHMLITVRTRSINGKKR
jgi:hypothetical protein